MKYVLAYKKLPGHGQKPETYELEYDRWKREPHVFKVVNGIPYEKEEEVAQPAKEKVAMPEVALVDMGELHASSVEMTPADEFALLKQEGFANLKGEARKRYQELKALCE